MKELFSIEVASMKAKNTKKKKQYEKITPEIQHQVIKRYLRYCNDQHAFEFLCYRTRLNKADLSFKQKVGFKIRIGTIKQYQRRNSKLELQQTQEKDFKQKIERLIPCLKPDLKEKDQKDEDKMSVRYIADDQTIYKFDPELQTPNWLAENYPL